MKHLFFLIASFVLITSCGINRNDISGRVTEFGSNNPVEGAKLTLFGEENGGFGSDNIKFFIDSLFTDANGEFYYEDPDQATMYSIGSITKENYWDDTNGRFWLEGDGRDLDIVLDPFAWLRITAENVEDIDGESIKIFGNSFVGSNNVSSNELFDMNFKLKGNNEIVIAYLYNDSQIDTTIIDSIFCKAFDTSSYHINF